MEAITTVKIKEVVHLDVKAYCAKNKLPMLDFYSKAAQKELNFLKKKIKSHA